MSHDHWMFSLNFVVVSWAIFHACFVVCDVYYDNVDDITRFYFQMHLY